MQDKFHIETYREHEIWYNAESDKFTVELLIEDKWNEKGRKSLKDCRKVIDDHIKSNLQFKPISCLFKNWGSVSEALIKSVRSDGGVLVYKDGKEQNEISAPVDQLRGNSVSFYKYSPDYVEWMEAKEALLKKHRIEVKQMEERAPKLEPMDMTFINQFIKPN